MTKSTKFDKAIGKIEDKAIIKSGDGGALAVPVPQTNQEAMEILSTGGGIVQRFDPQKFVENLVVGGAVMGEKFVTLMEGQQVTGFLVKRGFTEVQDPNDPSKTNIVEKFRMEQCLDDGTVTGAVFSMLSSAQLDTYMKGIPADGSCMVSIAKGGDIKTRRGRNVSEFYFWAKRNFRGPTHDAVADSGVIDSVIHENS
jgi:hypothetical protein